MKSIFKRIHQDFVAITLSNSALVPKLQALSFMKGN